MGKKLYVGNLTYSVTHSNLEEWFAQYRDRPERPGDHGP